MRPLLLSGRLLSFFCILTWNGERGHGERGQREGRVKEERKRVKGERRERGETKLKKGEREGRQEISNITVVSSSNDAQG